MQRLRYDYRAVPFVVVHTAKQSPAAAAAGQFQDLIHQMQAEGYEYVRMDQFSTAEPPGCLAGFFGAKTEYVRHDVALFRKPLG